MTEISRVADQQADGHKSYRAGMQAMVLEKPGGGLKLVERPDPAPGPGQVLVRVAACGVCRTDLHIADGDLRAPKLPLIPGHEIVGRVEALGPEVTRFRIGERVGIPWLGHTCGACVYCRSGQENLCDLPGFTGYQIDGGYAELTVADADYCFPISEAYSDIEAAPLLCAGLIGFRSLRMAGTGECLGIYGFGAAAHIVAQVARHEGRRVHAFTRPGDRVAQDFAMSLGCTWAGGSDQPPPVPLDAAIIFAPVGGLVPVALTALRKGGTVVLGGIHMSDIPAMPYEIIWGERVVRSVANLTRRDAIEFLALAPRVPVRTHVVPLPLSEANAALDRLRRGELTGAAVLVP
jgi:propanol-preferring alcohol dehydrogenase